MASEQTLKKLRNRLLLINMISLTLVISIAFTIIYLNFYNRTQNEIRESLYSIPRGVNENVILFSLNQNMSAGGEPGSGDNLTIRGEQRIPADYTKSFVVNIANDGEITLFSLLDIKTESYVRAIETVLANRASSGVAIIDGRSWMYSIERGAGENAAYALSIVFLDIDDATRGLGNLLVSLIIIGIAAIAAILLISLFVSNRAIRPVEESIARQRRFVADASHELKTPIAVIAANAEAASGAADEGERSVWIDNITDETNRMNELVDSLLSLAKAEEKPAELTAFDLFQASSEEADSIEAFLFEKDIVLEVKRNVSQDESLEVVSDKAKVQAIISVLLENALKYTPEGGRVQVSVSRGRVSVSNTGDYIPPEKLEHLFDRFYRADSSRNSETGGHGIGLSIAKEIANALGCELKAESGLQENEIAINTFTLNFANIK